MRKRPASLIVIVAVIYATFMYRWFLLNDSIEGLIYKRTFLFLIKFFLSKLDPKAGMQMLFMYARNMRSGVRQTQYYFSRLIENIICEFSGLIFKNLIPEENINNRIFIRYDL